ncbi:MAG: hypothetical protein GF383_11955 [Candidatus Lokiarchaeota archaeon]|nr:hypothetical protein [Candidatus Lokiarchaeota archaeon]MBD3341588.1 hypothetical protein [Candidatus Lokiarchaeota archaeon]
MLELMHVDQEVLQTKDRVTIDLIDGGRKFLEQFEVNHECLIDTISIVYQFLQVSGKIPHNFYKFVIAAYYINLRHPKAFPAHEPKKKFCRKFGIKESALDYSVNKITSALSCIRILDDKNYPYYICPRIDLGFKSIKNIVQDQVEKAMMNFMFFCQPIDAQILSEELTSTLVFQLRMFPEELFRQFYDIISKLVEEELSDFREYKRMRDKYLL